MLNTLQGISRINELAVMLGVPEYTETSLNDARELMQKAETWKQSRREGS